MEYINYISGGVALASIFGTIAASFYGVRQKTIITTLQESNSAYKERNGMLEEQLKSLTAQYSKDISELKGNVATLTNMKTPQMGPLIQLITENHTEVMQALNNKRKRS